MKAYRFEGKMGETVVEMPIPEGFRSKAESMREQLIEKAAEQTDDLMEKYLETMDLTIDEIKR